MFTYSIDIIADFEKILHKEIDIFKRNGFRFIDFTEWKSKYNKSDEDNNLSEKYNQYLIHSYFNLRERLIVDNKRIIEIAKNFTCPEIHNKGLDFLTEKIKNGTPLFPHLSRRIFFPDDQDGLLFDFGIYHLHLGTVPDPKYPKLIKGTKEVLYCVFDDDKCYYLTIDDHGKWASFDLLRIIQNNFPHILERWELKGILDIEKRCTEKEIIQLRKAGVNCIFELDGRFYASLGGGINTARTSTQATLKMNRHYHFYKFINDKIISIIESNRDKIENEHSLTDKELNFKVYDITKLDLRDSKNNLKLIVNMNADRTDIESIDFDKIK